MPKKSLVLLFSIAIFPLVAVAAPNSGWIDSRDEGFLWTISDYSSEDNPASLLDPGVCNGLDLDESWRIITTDDYVVFDAGSQVNVSNVRVMFENGVNDNTTSAWARNYITASWDFVGSAYIETNCINYEMSAGGQYRYWKFNAVTGGDVYLYSVGFNIIDPTPTPTDTPGPTDTPTPTNTPGPTDTPTPTPTLTPTPTPTPFVVFFPYVTRGLYSNPQ